jgi:hypothetical protein
MFYFFLFFFLLSLVLYAGYQAPKTKIWAYRTVAYFKNALKEKANAKLMDNRKYVEVQFTLGGEKYIYFIPYNRKCATKQIKIQGSTSKKVYNFHPGMVPIINCTDFAEESWQISVNGENSKTFFILDNFSG